MPLRATILPLVAAGLVAGCRDAARPPGEGPIIAEAGKRELYLSDARGVVLPGSSGPDSIAALADYAERWSRDAVVAAAAEVVVGRDEPGIERLVADYRDRLLRLRYEERFAAEHTDTSVAEAELEELYAEEAPAVDAPGGIARVILLRYAGELPDEDEFDEDWAMLRRDTAAKARVLEHGRTYAELALSDESVWRDVGAVSALAGGLDPERIRDGANVRRKGSYLRVLDYVGPGQPAPLAYVRDRLRKTAITRRRADIIAAERARLYDEARASDAVKIYLADE